VRRGRRRRYSDFDWLRELLAQRFNGVCVPLMPEKRVIGNQGQAFIEERMAGLEQFMLLLLSNPYIRNDATLKMFLTLGGTAEFDQAKKAASGGVGANPTQNPGLARWFGVLRALPLPADADAACAELTASTDDLEARAMATLGGVTRYWESARAMGAALRAMNDSLSDWAQAAATNSAGLSDTLRVLKANTGVLSEKVKHAGGAFSNAHDLAVFSPNEIQIFLMDGVVTELHRLKSLKALMAQREAAQNEYGKAWMKQDRLHAEQKQWREKGREDRAVALESKTAEAVQEMKGRKERLDDISKGALYIESDKCSRARNARFVAMVGQYAALCIASGARTQELWTAFMATMGLNQGIMVKDAQDTLTGKASMHGLDAIAGSPLSLPAPHSVIEGAEFGKGGGGGGGGGSEDGKLAGGEPASTWATPAAPAPSAPPPAAVEQEPVSSGMFGGSNVDL